MLLNWSLICPDVILLLIQKIWDLLYILSSYRAEVPDSDKPNNSATRSQPPGLVPEISLRDQLGNAATLDVGASDISWDTLYSLHHTKHTSSNEYSEDELNKALEVCCCKILAHY